MDSVTVNKNPQFTLNGKYSQLLVTIFINNTVGGGMPLLIIFCTLSLFFQFWIDKYLLFRYNSFDEVETFRLQSNDIEQGIYVLKLMPLSLLFHIAFSIISYGNSSIFPDVDGIGLSMQNLKGNEEFLLLY
jgi:hypothetical protein